MKFHTTKRTLFISLGVLILLSLFVIFFAISITFFSIDEPIILSSILNIENTLGIQIEVESIETNIFTRVAIHGISITDSNQEKIATVDSVVLDVPIYTLLPRYLFNQSIPIVVKNSTVTLHSSHLSLMDNITQSENGDSILPFSIKVDFHNSKIAYSGDTESISVIVPSFKGELEKGRVTHMSSLVSKGIYSSKEIHLSLENLLLEATIDTNNAMSATVSTDYVEGLLHSLELQAQFDSSSFTYNGDVTRIKGNIEGSLYTLHASYLDENLPIEYRSKRVDLFGSHRGFTLENLTAQSSDYIVEQSSYLLSGDLFTFGYEQGSDSLRLHLNNQSLISISHSPFTSLMDAKLELSLKEDIQSVRFEGSSISLLAPEILEQMIKSSLIEEAKIIDPYILISKKVNEETYVYETSGSVVGNTSFIVPQTIDVDFSSDGTIDDSLTLKNVRVSLSDLTSSRLAQTYSVDALYNEILLFPLELTLRDKDSLSVSLKRDFITGKNQLLFKSRNTLLSPYKNVIELFVPTISPYITNDTTLTGEVSVELDDRITDGKVNASIAFQEIAIGANNLNAASTLLASINSEELVVDLATITTTGVRVSYAGSIDRLTWLPKGVLEATDVKLGTSLAAVDFTLLENQEVGYSITSSLISSLNIKGLARYASSFSFIETNGTFDIFEESYPFKSSFNNQKGKIETSLPGLSIIIDLITKPGHLDITTQADSFLIPLPFFSFIKETPYIDGNIEVDFSLSDNVFLVKGENMSISNISLLGIDRGKLNTSITLTNTQLLLDQLTFIDSVGSLTGTVDIQKPQLLSLFSGDTSNLFLQFLFKDRENEIVDMRLVEDSFDTNKSIMTLFINSFPLERISPSYKNSFASLIAAGVSDFTQVMDIEGRIDLTQDISNPLTGELFFSVTNEGIIFYDGFLKKGNFSANNIDASLLYNGKVNAHVDVLHKKAYVWREADTKMSLDVELFMQAENNFFDFVTQIPYEIENWETLSISHSATQFFGMVDMTNGSHLLSRKGNVFTVEPLGKGSINATYNTDTHYLDIKANKDFLFPLEGKGIVSATDISMDLSYIAIDLTYLNAIFGEPIINFETGLFEGSVLIDGALANPQFFGTMSSDEVAVSLFWTGDQKISIVNPIITLGENLFNLPYTKATVKKRDGRDSEGLFKAEMLFENWNISNYQLNADINKGTLALAISIPEVPLYIEADANGTFGLVGNLNEEKISGDIYIPSGRIGFDLPPLPNWFQPKARTSIEMNFTSGKNITFVYPNEESPIVSATVADNQKLSVSMSSPSMVTILQGDIALRSGEIYYIQENFYITEGSLVFPKEQVGNIEAAEPRLNLRARLRKFDLEGNRIDIFLILQNDSISSINPRFDSFPLRTNNEILQILGQNLLNTNFAENPDGGFQSVVSAASAATNVISRLGLIQGGGITFGFSSIIRQSLGLDVFSIRSNLLQNILIEAIPGMSSEVSVSPISRYLDNTTLYLGKYLLDELYLQGLVTFRRDFTGTRSSFLAEDLAIDTELSIEWLNDLATFSFFTQPEELSLFNLFDTMGFSITKNFEF